MYGDMLYTPQQQAGSLKFCSGVLLGNWREDSAARTLAPKVVKIAIGISRLRQACSSPRHVLRGDWPAFDRPAPVFVLACLLCRIAALSTAQIIEKRLCDYMDKKERGELSVANKQKSRQLKSVALSASSAGTLCSGDVLMLRSRCNGGFLATALGQTLGGSDHHPVFCCRSSAPTVSSYAASIASIGISVAEGRRPFLRLLPSLRAIGMHSSECPQQLLFPWAMKSNTVSS